MSKEMKITLGIAAIVLLVFAILFAIYANNKSEPMNSNTHLGTIVDDPNNGLQNMLGNIFDEENETENTNSANSNSEVEEDITNGDTMTAKETKAISLVKKEWIKKYGSTDDVSFSVSIQNDGKYGVTVYDTTTTKSIQFYIVDVDTEIVTER